jgi:hypothetical protein
MTAEAVAAGETTVEVVLPEGGSSLQLSCSGWSWVAGVDAVGGSPHGYFSDDADVWLPARRCPNGLRTVLAGLISDVIGKVDHQPGTAWPDIHPKRADHEALEEFRVARAVVRLRRLGVLGGANPGRRPCLQRCGVRGQRRLRAGGGVGAPRSRPPTRGDVL